MSGIAYRPPSENLAIFDPSVFLSQDQPLTYDVIANNFLQFPNGQGTETIPSLIVPGTSTLGVTNASTLNLSDTLNIANGANTSTFDMNASNNLTINNNVAGGNMFFNIKDPTLGIVSNTVSFTKSGGLNSGCSVPNNPPTTASNFVCFTASSASTTTALQLCVSPNSGSYNAIVAASDPFIVGTGAGSNLGSLVLTAWGSSALGIRINTNKSGPINSVVTEGALIQLNATTTGGLTSSTTITSPTDSSNKIPTTAWVQGAILANPSASIPYYQVTAFFRNLAYGRAANIYFNFSGVAWGLNEFFTVSFRYEVNSVLTASVSNQPTTDFTVINGSVDIYPYRCPLNIGTDTAYGIGQAGTTPANFPQFNNNIYKPSTSSYSSAFDLGTNDATYYPYGRYFWVSNYSIAQQGTQYSQTSPTNGLLPLQPYIPSGTPGQQKFGFALWNYNTTSTYTQYNNLSLQLTNRGSRPITITGDYLVFGDATVNTSGF